LLFSPKLCFLVLILLLVFRDGWTPLHRSISDGHLEACRLLLQSGADVNAKTK
jgi:ankyrin repeat protein